MKVLIIEDEIIARNNLANALKKNYPDIEIAGTTSSVKESIEWLAENKVDAIFMDIELSDGIAFEIFRQTKVNAHVVMTTAFSSYAISAFEAGSLDYLLKPISAEALDRAVKRLVQYNNSNVGKDRFIIEVNGGIIPIKVDDIAYLYSDNKSNYLMMNNGHSYVLDGSLDKALAELDPAKFYKISRSCIISRNAITNIQRSGMGKNILNAIPKPPFEFYISRGRMEGFKRWLKDNRKS